MSIAHRRLRWTGGLLLLSIGLAGCDLITGNAPEASTIVISPSGITLDAIGATATLSAEVRDQNDQILGNEVVTWSSSDPNVATISPAGLVTAVRKRDRHDHGCRGSGLRLGQPLGHAAGHHAGEGVRGRPAWARR